MPAATIRRIAGEYLEAASIGATIEIDGKMLPLRPVAVTLGKSVNNGWGAFECCWSRTVLAALVGALEVPAARSAPRCASTVRRTIVISASSRAKTASWCQHFNPTGSNSWEAQADRRATLHARWCRSSAATAAGARRWARRSSPGCSSENTPADWPMPEPTYPEIWFVYRSNPAISFWQTRQLSDAMRKLPFMVAFAYTVDETNYMADLLLPEATDLESRRNSSAWADQIHGAVLGLHGVVLRQKAVEPQGEARDFTVDHHRTGQTHRPAAANISPQLNRGISGVVAAQGRGLTTLSLDPEKPPEPDEIWDCGLQGRDQRRCRRARRRTASTGSRSTASTPCRVAPRMVPDADAWKSRVCATNCPIRNG